MDLIHWPSGCTTIYFENRTSLEIKITNLELNVDNFPR